MVKNKITDHIRPPPSVQRAQSARGLHFCEARRRIQNGAFQLAAVSANLVYLNSALGPPNRENRIKLVEKERPTTYDQLLVGDSVE